MISHWDDLEPSHEAEGTIEFEGYDLGEAAGTRDVGEAHTLIGGTDGLDVLAFYYPRSNKIYFRGVGVMARLDHLAYEVGEESTV